MLLSWQAVCQQTVCCSGLMMSALIFLRKNTLLWSDKACR